MVAGHAIFAQPESSMSTPKMTATMRTRAGKGAARAERRAGLVPAVIYGGGEAPVLISLPFKDVNTRIHAGKFLSTVVELDVAGSAIRALPRDFALDKVDDFPIHVDFLRVTAGSRIRVEVPVHFLKQEAAPGIKAGGVLNIVMHTIELVCPPDAIPPSIDVDLTGLEIGDSVHRDDLKLPDGVKPTTKGNFTVASIAPPQVDAGPAQAAPSA